jgi:hypothetical protein
MLAWGKYVFSEFTATYGGGLIMGANVLLISLASGEIDLKDRLRWSWRNALIGQLLGSIVSVLISSSAGRLSGSWWFNGFFGGLVGGLFANVWREVEEITSPGQRLKMTFLNSIAITIIFGSVLIFSYAGDYMAWSDVNFKLRLAVGVGLGLLMSLNFGLMSLIRHYLIRLILYLYDLMPGKLISFLDHASGLIFMRRIGSGFIFVHRLLMEHFASLKIDHNTSSK